METKVNYPHVYTKQDFIRMLDYKLLAWWIFAHEDSQESTPDTITKWIEDYYLFGRITIAERLAAMEISK